MISRRAYSSGVVLYMVRSGESRESTVKKTTVYLPDSLKRDVERRARELSCSEAKVIRQAIRDAVGRPEPRPGILPGDDSWIDRIDDHMEGFGER